MAHTNTFGAVQAELISCLSSLPGLAFLRGKINVEEHKLTSKNFGTRRLDPQFRNGASAKPVCD